MRINFIKSREKNNPPPPQNTGYNLQNWLSISINYQKKMLPFLNLHLINLKVLKLLLSTFELGMTLKWLPLNWNHSTILKWMWCDCKIMFWRNWWQTTILCILLLHLDKWKWKLMLAPLDIERIVSKFRQLKQKSQTNEIIFF